MTTAIPTITTSRLILRPLDLTDADAVQSLFPRWEIVRFLGTHVPWPYPADGALTFIRDVALSAMRRGAGWHWSIRPKAMPEQLIGAILVGNVALNFVGYWVAHIASIAKGMEGSSVQWTPAASALLLAEFATIALILGSAFFFQARKKDFL